MARFSETKLLNIKCVFWFFLQLLSETLLSLRRIKRDIINLHRSSCKLPLFLSNFNQTWIFSTDSQINLIWRISRKSVQWERLKWSGIPRQKTRLTCVCGSTRLTPCGTRSVTRRSPQSSWLFWEPDCGRRFNQTPNGGHGAVSQWAGCLTMELAQ